MLNHPEQLSKYPALNNLEKQTNVPKAYGVIGVVALYFFFIIFNLGGQLLTNFAGFVLPAYYSTAALFSANKEDDTQWLTVRLPFPYQWSQQWSQKSDILCSTGWSSPHSRKSPHLPSCCESVWLTGPAASSRAW